MQRVSFRRSAIVIAVLALAALARPQLLLADEADKRLQKRVAELEAENQALRKIISGIQAALRSVPASSTPPITDPKSLRILVAAGEWGGSELADIQKVCASAAGTIWAQLPEDGFAPIVVERGNSSPITLFKRGEGNEFIVRLDTGDRAWAQCGYQFAHEFCHIVCNYRDVKNPQLWIEESLCECASLFALRRMAVEWETKPPYSNWKSYSVSLASYASDRMKPYADRTESVAKFYETNRAELEKNAANRELNTFVAVKLLPLFEETPAAWQSLRYINLGLVAENDSLKEYLAGWHARVPAEHKPFVKKLAAEFGFEFE